MKHTRSIFEFESGKDKITVEYSYVLDEEEFEDLVATVLVNNEIIHYFETIPYTKTENPTKSQAKELIIIAKKESKKPKELTRKILTENG